MYNLKVKKIQIKGKIWECFEECSSVPPSTLHEVQYKILRKCLKYSHKMYICAIEIIQSLISLENINKTKL